MVGVSVLEGMYCLGGVLNRLEWTDVDARFRDDMAHGSILNAPEFLLGTDYFNELCRIPDKWSLRLLLICDNCRSHFPCASGYFPLFVSVPRP
jgi:hypothetical protein